MFLLVLFKCDNSANFSVPPGQLIPVFDALGEIRFLIGYSLQQRQGDVGSSSQIIWSPIPCKRRAYVLEVRGGHPSLEFEHDIKSMLFASLR